MHLPDNKYRIINVLNRLIIPLLICLYSIGAVLFHFPYAARIIAALSALDFVFGAILKIAEANYNGDGRLVIEEGVDKDIYRMELDYDISELSHKDEVVFKVDKAYD